MLKCPSAYVCRAIIHGPWRYRLTRSWGGDPAALVWIMLNPSVANASADDPTIRRVRGFSEALGFGGFTVVNLFAEIQTDPAMMGKTCDPVGPENDAYIAKAAEASRRIVCAWGASSVRLVDRPCRDARAERAKAVMGLLAGHALHCLGTTSGGHPRHPLYVRGDQELLRYRQADRA